MENNIVHEDKNIDEKANKIKEIISKNAQFIFNEVEKIVGRPLTDEEREKLDIQCQAFFMISGMMMTVI